MVIEIEPTEQDFVQAWLFSGRRVRRVNLLARCFTGLALCWLGWLGYLNHDIRLVPFGGAGVYILLETAMSPARVRQSYRKLWANHPVYGEPARYNLDDDGFTSQSYSGKSTMRWHAFSHWNESSKFFMIFFGPVISYYIPKRCIGSDANIDEVRTFLKQTIGRTKYTPPVRAFPVDPILIETSDAIK